MRVPEAGGTPTTLIKPAVEITERWPQVLPGSKAVIFSAAPIASNFDDANIVVQQLSGGQPKILERGGTYGRYVPSGHLLYVHSGTLFAAPFDLDRLEVTGRPVPVVDGVDENDGTGAANFAVANNGTLVYLSGQTAVDAAPIFWMDHSGQTTPLRAMPADWSDPRFSPDGTKLAMVIATAGIPAIWIYDWSRDTTTRLTSGLGATRPALDSRRLTGSSSPRPETAKAPTFSGSERMGRETSNDSPVARTRSFAGSWHPSGKILAFREVNSADERGHHDHVHGG